MRGAFCESTTVSTGGVQKLLVHLLTSDTSRDKRSVRYYYLGFRVARALD